MSNHGAVYDGVEQIVAKLYVLRDSCTGTIHADESNPNLIWFQGAEAILKEAVDGLQEALQAMEGGETGGPVVAEETEEEAEAESEEDQEETSTEESE
jgi:hypothetical protein